MESDNTIQLAAHAFVSRPLEGRKRVPEEYHDMDARLPAAVLGMTVLVRPARICCEQTLAW